MIWRRFFSHSLLGNGGRVGGFSYRVWLTAVLVAINRHLAWIMQMSHAVRYLECDNGRGTSEKMAAMSQSSGKGAWASVTSSSLILFLLPFIPILLFLFLPLLLLLFLPLAFFFAFVSQKWIAGGESANLLPPPPSSSFAFSFWRENVATQSASCYATYWTVAITDVKLKWEPRQPLPMPTAQPPSGPPRPAPPPPHVKISDSVKQKTWVN